MAERGLSERCALAIVKMSSSALRYEPAPDCNQWLLEKINALAQRHRRYGAGMIYLKIKQEGSQVNRKCVDRPYALAALQIRKRKRKKIPVSERQPLLRPEQAN